MKRFTTVLAIITAAAYTLIFCGCRQTKNAGKPVVQAIDENEKMAEDWRLAAAFEFKITKDASLGYVPKYRLYEAGEEMKQGRFARSGASRAAALTWTERGPSSDSQGPNGNPRSPGVSVSGRADAIWVDLADPTRHTIWVGTHSGGIWKTNDINVATPVWTPVFDMMGNLGIGSICQDPVNHNIMYVGSGDKTNFGDVRGGGVWKSADHGLTWNLLPSTTGFWSISKVVCDASGNVYISGKGVNAGVWRSSNGGLTWTDITPAGLSKQVPDMDMSENGTLHIYCGFWEVSQATCGYRYSISPSTATPTSGWKSPSTPFPLSIRTAQLTVSGNTVLAMPVHQDNYNVPQFYRSTDGGANWAPTGTTPDARYWSCLDAAINPANNNEIIFGSFNCFGTTDGGNTWVQRADGGTTARGYYVHHDYHAIVWNGNEIIIGSDGGIFFSSDNGTSFSSKNAGIRSFEFYTVGTHPTDPDFFIGGTQDNGMELLSQPGLGSGLHVIGGDAGYTHVDQNEPSYVFGSTTGNNFRRSVNGGINWVAVDYSFTGQFINPTDYDDADNKMYCASSANEYLRWENPQTGNTFTPVAVAAYGGSRISSLVLSPYTSKRMFTTLENGKIFQLDNIETNNPVVTDISGTGRPTSYIASVNPGTDENNLIITYPNYGTQHVWITANHGANWINVQGNLPDIPVRWGMFHPDDNDRAYIATDLGVWSTDDLNGAATIWAPETGIPSVRCSMLQYQASTRTLALATHGRGIWTATLPPLKPFIRFASPAFLNTAEQTTQTTGCRRYKDYTITLNIDMPPTGDATVNLQVTGGATATQGEDYNFTTNGNFTTPSSQIIFPSGSSASKSFTLRIYDDAVVEGPEAFSFTYSITGATNAVIPTVNNSYKVTIADNDTAPAAPAAFTRTIGVGDYNIYEPFRSFFPVSKTQFIYLASELRAAGYIAGPISSIGFNMSTKSSTTPYSLTISLKNTTSASFPSVVFEGGTTTCYTGSYSTVAGMNSFNFPVPFNWDGVSNLLVEVCYNNTGTTFNSDIISGSRTTSRMAIWADGFYTGTGCTLPANDGAFYGTTFARADITINGLSGTGIETVQGRNVTEYAFGNGKHYFYTNGNGNIISQLSNISADPGCVTANVIEAGNSWQPFTGGLRSQKVIEVTPSQNSSSSCTIGVYFTAAELSGFAPATLRLAKTTAATMAAANTGNTIISPTTVTPYGNGYLFTASFTGFGKFFLSRQEQQISFASNTAGTTINNVTEQTTTTAGCLGYTDYIIKMNITAAPVGDAVVTLSADAGSTATQGRDFAFTTNGSFSTPSNTIVFPSGASNIQPGILVRVFDDGETEQAETLVFTFSISGETTAVKGAANQTFTFNIADNDPPPASPIQSAVRSSRYLNINSKGIFYFYEPVSSNIIGKTANTETASGCTFMYLARSGNAWINYGAGSRSQKTIMVVPEIINNPYYTISLYYTNAELAGRDPQTLRIAKYDSYQVLEPPVLSAFPGRVWGAITYAVPYRDGYCFTASFIGGSGQSLAGVYYLIDDKVNVQMSLAPGQLTSMPNKNASAGLFNQSITVTNPFTSQLKLHFARAPKNKVSLKLENSEGRLVYSGETMPAAVIAVDLSGKQLSNGVYYLEVWADERKYTYKLVKQ